MSAKFNLLVAGSVALVPLIPLLACGGDDGNKIDSGITVHDSNGSGSGSGSGSGNCPVMANWGTPNISQSGAFWTAGSAADATNVLDWEGVLPSSDQEIISIRIFGGCGSGSGSACGGFPTPDWPTTFAPKSNLNLANVVDAAVVIFAGIGSNGQASTIYLSSAGTLNVTSASNGSGTGHTYAGSISGVTLVHIDPSTGMPLPDNCMSAVTSLNFTGTAMFEGKQIQFQDANVRPFLAHRYQ